MILRSAPLALGLALSAIPAAAVAQPVTDAASGTAEQTSLFAAELRDARAFVDGMIGEGVVVPVPKDPGGGYTHEQHKRNYRALQLGGRLYSLTGERKYADYVRDVLLAYAKLYPKLDDHPAKANQHPGRLFWQVLNDAVWLVHAAQGYEAIRDILPQGERRIIDENVFRAAARFLAVDSRATFDRIHNHATWAAAGVGMTGYVLGDQALVDLALRGSDGTGRTGFLRQVDELFSPDGYYAEGPYYQRYALLPFLVFADAIERREPGRRIFERREGVLLKALDTTIQLTYGGCFFPLNDALKDKCLRTDELYEGVAIGYARTKAPGLLSIAQWQGRTVLTAAGQALSMDLADGKARPFPFRTTLLRDGPGGEKGALAVLREGAGFDGSALIAKNTSQGMGHGHFDKLGWQFYDNGNEVVTDYGAARFLNIPAKEGGRYLPENETWAKQTIAHNTLVVDGKSHFGGDPELAERHAPRQLAFVESDRLKLSAAEIDSAYPGVRMQRVLALVRLSDIAEPLVVDVLRSESETAHVYQLPLHFNGHIMRSGFVRTSFTQARPVLGDANGLQHIWIDARGQPKSATDGFLTWLTGDRFYTARWIPQSGATVLIGESGANDPDFNLRREPMVIQQVSAVRSPVFVTVLEPHGRYDGAAERTDESESRVASLSHQRSGQYDLVTVERRDGRKHTLAISWVDDPDRDHTAIIEGRDVVWRGFAALVDNPRENAP
ncbi:Heparinase II/III-like protein [Tsuneonella dongtanensis]|uniref:Heparinase II/III-like protein n=1 Tax=Tsuneonella dongtanensis TaxID=692370 RepID=A0A1B2ADL4_9SPHN|nr:alginate lyase family protein [Tsuneonella dongtanensis]ANY20233.1 Heparinase II/III-like protein [Tsuneonella dongtanensis]